jgi:hypothetical protein
MSFEIEGLLHKVFETENKTDTFQTREFVIETEDRGYKNYIKFQLTQDRCQIIDGYSEGQIIKVGFDLRGREWQGRYFTNLNAWKVDKVEAALESPPDQSFGKSSDPFAGLSEADEVQTDNVDDDLPF